MTRQLVRSVIRFLSVLLLLPSISLGSAPTVGEQAPPFIYSDLNAGGVSLFETFERNRPIILAFLQTACRSCHREAMTLKRLKEELGNFGVMAVFIDMTQRNIKKYTQENELPFTCTWDSSGDIAESYGVTFSPTSFLLDAERKVIKVYRGFHPGVERALRNDLEALVKR